MHGIKRLRLLRVSETNTCLVKNVQWKGFGPNIFFCTLSRPQNVCLESEIGHNRALFKVEPDVGFFFFLLLFNLMFQLTIGTFCAVTYNKGSEGFLHFSTFWGQMMHWAQLDHQTDSTVDTPVVSWVNQPSGSTVLPSPILSLHTTPSLTNKCPFVLRLKIYIYILLKWLSQPVLHQNLWPTEQEWLLLHVLMCRLFGLFKVIKSWQFQLLATAVLLSFFYPGCHQTSHFTW